MVFVVYFYALKILFCHKYVLQYPIFQPNAYFYVPDEDALQSGTCPDFPEKRKGENDYEQQ